MISEIPYTMIISGVALVGLWISNILYDLKVPHYLSRKIGHSAGVSWPFLLAFFVLMKKDFKKAADFIVIFAGLYLILLVLGQALG
jgi:hypothetical protein